ncbi:hypothetical protein C8R44DRAFT_735996 [Mycena epipterygia]|nr:hypothetical protein C8R44DRAFT_735996 [Mycena epipterygia]
MACRLLSLSALRPARTSAGNYTKAKPKKKKRDRHPQQRHVMDCWWNTRAGSNQPILYRSTGMTNTQIRTVYYAGLQSEANMPSAKSWAIRGHCAKSGPGMTLSRMSRHVTTIGMLSPNDQKVAEYDAANKGTRLLWSKEALQSAYNWVKNDRWTRHVLHMSIETGNQLTLDWIPASILNGSSMGPAQADGQLSGAVMTKTKTIEFAPASGAIPLPTSC